MSERTAAESAALVTPADYALPEGHVERYATWRNSSTDFTAAFQAAAAVARQKPGLFIQFTAGRIYATTATGGATLFNLQNARGVTVFGNGAIIAAGEISSGILDVFDLNGAQDIDICRLRYTQTYTKLDPANGARFFRIRKSAARIRITNCSQLGGYGGIVVIGDPATGGERSELITALDCRFEKVYYPQSFQASGDRYLARGIETIDCGRGYFPWNVRNHEVEMVSRQGGPFDDVLLKVYADPRSAYNRLENIKLTYWSSGKHASGVDTTSGAVIAFDIQQNSTTTTAGQISKVDVEVCFDAGVAPRNRKLIEFRKQTSAGTPDTTARGHVFSNIKIGGLVRGWANASSDCIDLFGTADGYDWAGESAFDIRISEFFAAGDPDQVGVRLNGQPFSSGRGVTLENVLTDMRVVRANWNRRQARDAVNTATAGLIARSSYESYQPSWTARGVNPAIGNGTIAGRYMRRGDRVKGVVEIVAGSTTRFGTGEYRFSLPVAPAAGEGPQVSSAWLLDSGTATYSASQIADGASVSTGPFKFARGDRIVIGFDYRAAP